ncbi:putative molybdopterin biosynthesis protein [Clostridium acetobutylicum]|uniref:Molybdopterin molybdenumtransferase n=1 Tax=Clostridium acetobutylicum (strain ATCC 824 / DSM 792 / JCM 1419 / IAM 19013 / LMG 5710 / NBRC 13948 / NRRL B-527 / VKM B-1787 / 2291 / W) TaxID=272562 RepID=Q97HJ1_CLOAB|nr:MULTISPECIES: molybdopterin biosynthesis protein [Clostridium]AAK79979.1 Molybdopterin biosynthesis enzyme, MoeA, fused to molibdopterin-binding domain [Clostridium acetobutylicum ATCC 824]ADZ21072.1 Molybdopterin biosynthesis enzyme, MoeA, fused to molibdopterin-binding domain [Clostridium acetobutylicum EA 2018]AEI34363.1 putative molybdopterin biosynthesis protein MoeA/LysR substrate binding-domain-containing protein [Clostridium acetobutylicum DSM 1731]AWV79590.1 molybdopterin biosynthes
MANEIYLSNKDLDESIKLYFNELLPIKSEKEILNTYEALGRVSFSPVYAKISSPFYNSSAMDGIAVDSKKTYGASDRNHVELVENKDYIVVDTGDPIPKEYDAVIMVEDLINIDKHKVAIYKSAIPWQHIRTIGEDIVEKQLIIPSKHVITPVDIGAMIAGGINKVCVYKMPVVGIIPTGDEIVEPGGELKTGDIIEFNSRVFSAQVKEWGGNPVRFDIVKDDYELIKGVVATAVDKCDIVLVNAGSSAGREDFTCSVIKDLGKVLVHGISVKPGKPVVLGIIKDKPVIGIPGYPVSAYFIMENICKKVVYSYNGMNLIEKKKRQATLSRRIMSSLKYLEFVRVKLACISGKYIATPISRGAGNTMSLVRADGILKIPQNIEGYEAGTKVKVELLKDEEEIKNTLTCIGSHDIILDIVSDLLHVKEDKYFLSSAHVGSMGGIMALKSGETHIAPIHLLDMKDGTYNISYIKKYLCDKNIALIKGVKRIQGLMVPKGNPLNLKSIEDISKFRRRFVNRQRGAGTRLLLDYNLKKLNISSKDINGYEREEFTHIAVAAVVAAGDADCGLGVYSAAKLMNLDFIEIGNEEYDFAIPKEFLKMDVVKKFIEVIQSNEFKRELDKIGGYNYENIGSIKGFF